MSTAEYLGFAACWAILAALSIRNKRYEWLPMQIGFFVYDLAKAISN